MGPPVTPPAAVPGGRSHPAIDLPTVRALVRGYRPAGPRPTLVLLTHILPTAVAYVEQLARVFDTSVVGIPYSANRLAVRRLRSRGCQVSVPAALADIPALVLAEASQAASRGRPVVLQEIGGYLAGHAGELAAVPHFRGVVEDTSNGHWRYEDQADTLTFPVLSIARSPIKALEDSQIGSAVAFSVERILRHRLYRVLRDSRVVIIGYGSIGTSCSAAFRQRGAHTAVCDIDPLRVMRASVEGFPVGSAPDLVQDAEIVVGATGHCSIDAAVVTRLRPGTVLASASSRQVEIDMPALYRQYRNVRIAPELEQFTGESGHFFVLNDGFPVNFRDNSVVGRYLDAVYAELFVCIREVAEGRARPGLHVSWGQLHREVAFAWCRTQLARSVNPDPGEGWPVAAPAAQTREPARLL
jgi:adenosylhomocysteinase